MGKKHSRDEAAESTHVPSKKPKKSVSDDRLKPRVDDNQCKQISPQPSKISETPDALSSNREMTYEKSISKANVNQTTITGQELSQALNLTPAKYSQAAQPFLDPSKALPPYTGHPSTIPPLPPILSEDLALVPFTHPGYLNGSTPSKLHTTYDRLEFLGDAYIEVIATRLIYSLFANQPAGRLSQHRELCVKNETLCEYAYAYGFDKRARLPSHITRADKKLWTKTMGDIFEAYVAAIIMSDPKTGFQSVEAWLTALWQNKLSPESQKPAYETQTADVNAKTDLAKRLVSKGVKLDYREQSPPTEIRGQGKLVFHIGVYITGWGWQNQHLGSGSGLSKSVAGAMAATDALGNPLIEKISALKWDFDAKNAAERAARGEGESLGKSIGQIKGEKKAALKEELDRLREEKEVVLQKELEEVEAEKEEALGKEMALIQLLKEEALKQEMHQVKSRKELDKDLANALKDC